MARLYADCECAFHKLWEERLVERVRITTVTSCLMSVHLLSCPCTCMRAALCMWTVTPAALYVCCRTLTASMLRGGFSAIHMPKQAGTQGCLLAYRCHVPHDDSPACSGVLTLQLLYMTLVSAPSAGSPEGPRHAGLRAARRSSTAGLPGAGAARSGRRGGLGESARLREGHGAAMVRALMT